MHSYRRKEREDERKSEGGDEKEERGLVSHGAGRPEVGQELEAQADYEVPDVACHLGSSDEDTPDQDHQDGVEGVADVSQSGEKKTEQQKNI